MNNTELQKGKLNVKIYNTADQLGAAAADTAAELLNAAISQNGVANLILATGTSQFQFLKHLQNKPVDWKRINVFHLDEYLGLPENHRASFRKYLKERILDKVKPKKVYFMNGNAPETEAEISRYEKWLQENPVDVACIGIGENGHIAFNDPPVADFRDPHLVKVVELDISARRQQLDEGWFNALDEVPTHALTLTIPAIMNSKAICCAVPEMRKAEAVFNTLNAEITTGCPATILRTHPNAVLFLDKDSASKIN